MSDEQHVITQAQENQSKNTRSNYWVFTLNNYTELDVLSLSGFVNQQQASYCIFGKEVGQSGTRHLQGYIEFPSRLRFNQVKTLLPRAYIAARKGNSQQASDYCKKDGDFLEFGTRSRSEQGRRKDLERVANLVKEGASLKRIAEEEPEAIIKYHKGIGVLKDLLQAPREITYHGPWKWSIPDNFQSLILWGNSGLGKTEFAKFLLPKALFVTHLDQLTKYASEEYEGIIFDDMSFTHIHREAQIHLVDFDCSRAIHVRYTTANIPRNTRKIFTTNVIDGNIFLDDPAINRRISKLHLE